MATVEYLDFGQSPICLVDATGIHRPPFEDVIDYLTSGLRLIFGEDLYLDNDCQDGQFVGLLAFQINNVNAALVEAYNSYAPSTAQGTGLSSVVKTNGIERDVPSYSTVDLLLIGQAGATIYDAVAQDDQNQSWILPSPITFPYIGQLVVTAQAAQLGAVTGPAGSINRIGTPQLGWQSVTNPNDASIGQPVESDPQLRVRQSKSTALPSSSLQEGLSAGLATVPNVGRINVVQNDSDVQDQYGIPDHSISAVVEGSDQQAIADIIRVKKGVGASTYGDVVVSSLDQYGVPHSIAFFRPTYVPIAWYVVVRTLTGYTRDVETAIKTALANYTSALDYGSPVSPGRAYVPANLVGTPQAAAFIIESLVCTRDGAAPPLSPTDVQLSWRELAQCSVSDISIQTVTE